MDTSLISQDLEPLNAQILQVEEAVVKLEGELRAVDAELEAFKIDQQHFDIVSDACNALERLEALGAGALFWDGVSKGVDTAGHTERLRANITAFQKQTGDIQDRRRFLQEKIDQHSITLDFLFDEVQEAYKREEERQEEFIVQRELSHLPYRPMLMPWSKDAESERRFRRALLVSMLWCLLFGITIPLVTLPIPDRTVEVVKIPERLAMLVKQEPVIPVPLPVKEKPKEKKEKPEKAEKPEPSNKPKKTPKEKPPKAKPAGDGVKVAKKKPANLGVLAFKNSFSDLMDEVPVAKLGTEARLKKPDKMIPGQNRAQRSLVALQATGSTSQGIGNYGVSRNLGNGGTGGGSGYGNAGAIGGVGTAKVESAVAGLMEEAGRPLSDGFGSGRTDEEIQIVFDRYKATLYRIYNKELRKDPTLRGKLLLKLTIEPGGEVSLCAMESTDLESSQLVAKIVSRVKRFNFGPKDGVQKVTILYPIDFLPAG
ncbi:MAG: AgmX/PglI C-terminal domain-containing protein [Desulforhopalus sp.]